MREIYRITRPGAEIEIKVPHHRSDGYWGDPTHVRPINQAVLSLFSKKNCRMFAERGWPNTPLADYIDVDFEIKSTNLELLPFWNERLQSGALTHGDLDHAYSTLWNVVDEVTIILVRV